MTIPPRMLWGVRSSFITYVRSNDGVVNVISPAVSQGDIYMFPMAEGDNDKFLGGLHLRAHQGLLDVYIRDPRIELHNGTTVLTINPTASGQGRIRFARLTESGSIEGDRRYAATLTTLGTMTLGGVYEVGARLNDIQVLGHPCHDLHSRLQ